MAWSPPMDQAFNAAKSALAAADELEHPQADFPISLMVDASKPSQGCPTAFLPLVLGPALLLQEADDASSAISCLALGDREGT